MTPHYSALTVYSFLGGSHSRFTFSHEVYLGEGLLDIPQHGVHVNVVWTFTAGYVA
jgi:hypothetical protein